MSLKMRIITVNLPEKDIKTIASLVGNDNNGLYPSRSELIRVAIRDFLVKELDIARNIPKFRDEHTNPEYTHITEIQPKPSRNFVRIPIEKTIGSETIQEYKTFKIVHK
ncbi:MAG: ribbon-helix-helix domain-containing protein [Promethearchaeota archaeon]